MSCLPFTMDSTEGYTQDQIDEMNRRFMARATDLDPASPHYPDEYKRLAQRVQVEFDDNIAL